MAEKNLLTLREIAEEIGIRYRTVIDCKNQFNDFFVVNFDGRNTKYPKKYADLFRLIFALKDEGYLAEDIRKIFTREHPNPPDFDGWIDGWIDGRRDGRTEGLTDGWTDGWTDGEMDGRMEETNSGNQNSSAREEQISEHSLDIHNIENRLSQLQSDLESQLSARLEQQLNEKVEQHIKEIIFKFEDGLLNLKGQINSSITEFYKAICQLQDSMKYLEQKMSQLQKDLGVEQLDLIEFPELDLNNLQIDTPNMDLECSTENAQEDNTIEDSLYADLEFVRKSIREGKPDKEAVIQWIHAQRNSDPPVSYGEIANMLNQEQIPTMKGKEGWNRGMVRNLAVRKNGI